MSHKHYTGAVEDTVRFLNTNAASGLSHKEARARYSRAVLSGEREFYHAPQKTLSAILAPCLSDFSFWTLLLTSGTLAFFENTRLALVCLLLLVLNLLLSVLLSAVSSSYASGLARGFRPKVKVIREGKLFLTDSRYAVRGDVVLLSAGDSVPFDARLIRSDALKVSVCAGRDKSGKARFVTAEKDAGARFDGRRELLPEERTNMVTAGSVILSGSARAVVTETGSYTYIGALMGGVSLSRAEEGSGLLPAVCRYTKSIGLWMLLLTVPLTVLAYFLGSPSDLAVSFLTVLSLSAALLPGWIIALLEFSAMRAIHRFVEDKRTSQGMTLRNAEASEKLASADVLLLFGTPMLSDGRLYVVSVYADGARYGGRSLNAPMCRALAEKALLLAEKTSEYPTNAGGRNNAIRELCRKELFAYADFVGADREMLRIRYQPSEYRAPTAKSPIEALICRDTATDSTLLLLSSSGEELLPHCTHIRINGKDALLTEEKRLEIGNEIRSARSRGEVCSYAEKSADGITSFLGFFTYAEVIPKGTKESLSALAASGIRPLLFLDGEGVGDRGCALTSGVCRTEAEIATASSFRREGRKITDGFGNYSAYLGFSREEIGLLMQSLAEHGVQACAVVLDERDASLVPGVALSVAVGEAVSGRVTKKTRELTELPLSGVRYGAEAHGSVKLDADMLVPRVSRRGGGLPLLIRAVFLGRRIDRNRRAFLSYLVLSFGLRAGWLLPALIGLGGLGAAIPLLFSGLIFDLFAGLVLLCNDREGDCMTGTQLALRKQSDVVRRYVRSALMGAVTGLLLSALPFLLMLLGVNFSAAFCGFYRAAVLILASIAFLLRIRIRDAKAGTSAYPFDRKRKG